jgi:hypothetical protein
LHPDINKNISLRTDQSDEKRWGAKTPLEWERDGKLKENILIIFPKI